MAGAALTLCRHGRVKPGYDGKGGNYPLSGLVFCSSQARAAGSSIEGSTSSRVLA